MEIEIIIELIATILLSFWITGLIYVGYKLLRNKEKPKKTKLKTLKSIDLENEKIIIRITDQRAYENFCRNGTFKILEDGLLNEKSIAVLPPFMEIIAVVKKNKVRAVLQKIRRAA